MNMREDVSENKSLEFGAHWAPPTPEGRSRRSALGPGEVQRRQGALGTGSRFAAPLVSLKGLGQRVNYRHLKGPHVGVASTLGLAPCIF